MKRAYFDCSSGAAGDMLLAAVVDVLEALDKAEGTTQRVSDWRQRMDALVSLEPEGRAVLARTMKAGIAAQKIDFYAGETHSDHHHHHHHRHLHTILDFLEQQRANEVMSEQAFDLSRSVFQILAEAEAFVHGTSVEKVHFHEVGAFDSIMDIAGFAVAFSLLSAESVQATPVTLGSGFVTAAHGVMSVPAPAVVQIMSVHQIPSAALELPGECLTPTGAAILAAIVKEWTSVPVFSKIEAQGVGAGTREIPKKANVVRLLFGEV